MTDINIGAITESLNYKSDLDLGNTSPQLVDYIVEQQLPSADNNYTWYDLYKSGKVRQGGVKLSNFDVTFPVEMANTNYSVVIGNAFYSNNAGTPVGVYFDKSTTGVSIQGRWNGGATAGIEISWTVEGMSAGV